MAAPPRPSPAAGVTGPVGLACLPSGRGPHLEATVRFLVSRGLGGGRRGSVPSTPQTRALGLRGAPGRCCEPEAPLGASGRTPGSRLQVTWDRKMQDVEAPMKLTWHPTWPCFSWGGRGSERDSDSLTVARVVLGHLLCAGREAWCTRPRPLAPCTACGRHRHRWARGGCTACACPGTRLGPCQQRNPGFSKATFPAGPPLVTAPPHTLDPVPWASAEWGKVAGRGATAPLTLVFPTLWGLSGQAEPDVPAIREEGTRRRWTGKHRPRPGAEGFAASSG